MKMDYDYSKWDKYEIGNIPWSTSKVDHLSKAKFAQYVEESTFNNILEIGCGEALEAQTIRKIRPDIDYNILDVSNTFLDNAKKLGFKTIKGEMHNTGLKDKEFDLVYLCAILEHSPNLEKTFEELKRISNNFYFSMFKWRVAGGGLKSSFHKNREYFTSVFNINKLLSLLSNYGNIEQLFICTVDGKFIDYEIYKETINKKKEHRNGNYLSIVGKFHDE